MVQAQRVNPRRRAPQGEVFAEKETKKVEVITEVTFKVGDKTYVAEFKKPANAKDVMEKMPKEEEGKKEVNKKFGDLAKEYEPVIYEKKGAKKIAVESPTEKIYSQAGKALVGDSMKKTLDVGKLVPKLK